MAPPTLSVVTYNIHKGFSASARAFQLEAIRDALHAVCPDVVFLQEVIGANARHARRLPQWPALPQLEYIAQREWPHAVYGQNASSRHGHHGNGILSKFPVKEWRNIDVSAHRFEQRGLLLSRIDVPGTRKDLYAFCVHFGLTAKGRDHQIDRLGHVVCDMVPKECPIIVAGDFNDWSERASTRLMREAGLEEAFLRRSGKHARTFPSRYPVLKLDRIYFRGLHLTEALVLTGKPWSTLSDHTPVAARFELR